MPKRKPACSTASIAHDSVLPLAPDVRRLVTRLNKASLVSLVARWLDPERVELYAPNLTVEDAYEDEPEELSLEEATEAYDDLRRSTQARAKDVAERMLDREWRDGLTMLAVAELDWEYLQVHPTSLKWSSLLLSPLSPVTSRPRFFVPTFLSALHSSLRPTQTAHFFTTTHPTLPLTLIRVSLHDPNADLQLPPRRKIFWLAFPQGSEHVFTTLSAGEGIRDLVIAGIADGVSRSGSRFELKAGRFQAKGLDAMCHYRGAEGGSGGLTAGWGVYVDGFEQSPLAPPAEAKENGEHDGSAGSRKRRLVEARFGKEEAQEGAAVESVFFELNEKYPDIGTTVEEDVSDDDEDGVFRPAVGIRFEGTHVFRGIRALAAAEEGMFAVDKMPGWAVGDEGVTSGVVIDGKVQRKKPGRMYNGT